MKMLKIGLIREGKVPPDSRVPITPKQCREFMNRYPNLDIVVQPSPIRCYKDEEYEAEGISLQEDMSDREVLMGVKEVPIEQLMEGKTYYFFSHTIKKQPYNRKLLQAILAKNIQMVDYETLKNEKGGRIIGFGRYAGIVGAHNGLRAYGLKTGAFFLEAAHKCKDFAAIQEIYRETTFPPIKIVSTGTGKVAYGAKETLDAMGIREVSPQEFLTEKFDEAVYVHLKYDDFYKHKESNQYDRSDFYDNPQNYCCDFFDYTRTADVFINGIYWDPKGPVYFTKEDMKSPDFNIKVIADVTCDIAPDSSVPSTIRPSKIGDDVYGYDPITEKEVEKYSQNSIDVMAVDNLPNELPRDASKDFGEMLHKSVIEEMMKDQSDVIDLASIAKNGSLTEHYAYLQDYVDGKA